MVLWLALFLGTAAAVVTRQREALQTAQRLSRLRDRRTELEGKKAEVERQLSYATSRAVLIPKMERAGLSQPTERENTPLTVDSLPPGSGRNR
jgi:hypothetical protein